MPLSVYKHWYGCIKRKMKLNNVVKFSFVTMLLLQNIWNKEVVERINSLFFSVSNMDAIFKSFVENTFFTELNESPSAQTTSKSYY